MTAQSLALTRRQLIGAVGLAGVATACQSAVGQMRKVAEHPGDPQYGGTLEAGITDDLIPGNLMTNSTAGITVMIGMVYEGLIRYPNDKVEPQPRLATSWKLGSDGRSLVLNLRDDVTFHSGRPFVSDDVEFSLKTYADPTWNGQLKSTAQAITRVDTSAPHRAVLHFEHPMGNIFDLLDTAPIIDKETADDIGTGKKFVGTGPFAFESWSPNAELVFKRYDDYWVRGRPYLDGARFSVVPDASSLVSSLKSSQVELANGLNYRDIESLRNIAGFSSIELTGAEQQIYVGANVEAKALQDLRLRQAIAYALDRERIVSEVFRGVGYVANLPWPDYSVAYDRARNSTYTLDRDKARELVDSIGTVPKIPLAYRTGSPQIEATALIVQNNLADVGIDVELDPVDQAQFVKQLIGAKFEALWINFHSWAQYVPSTLTVSAYPFNAADNSSHFNDPRYSDDARRAWLVKDGASAAARHAYGRLSDDLLKNLFLIEIGIVHPQWAMSGRVQGVTYTKRSEIDLRNAYLAQ